MTVEEGAVATDIKEDGISKVNPVVCYVDLQLRFGSVVCPLSLTFPAILKSHSESAGRTNVVPSGTCLARLTA